ncbi:MAG: hypothetical protein K8S25_10410 [Alphaproteobacteria bacterium]|nr:hypothetical protein [Alphaproteobacteria bacterium]
MTQAFHYVRLAIGVVALGLFVLALSVHVATIAGLGVEAKWPDVWYLHYGVFPLILATTLVIGRIAGPNRKFRDVIKLIPMSGRVLIGLAMLYALANFVLFIPATGAGFPVVRDGKFFFVDHGITREVSEAQFHTLRDLTIRLFSACWLFLYLVATLYLLFGRVGPAAPAGKTQ